MVFLVWEERHDIEIIQTAFTIADYFHYDGI